MHRNERRAWHAFVASLLLTYALHDEAPPFASCISASCTRGLGVRWKEGRQNLSEDLSLRVPKQYRFSNARLHVTYMTTFFMETLAERHHERISLVHVFPGLVMTDGFDNARLLTWLKLIWRWLAAPIIRPFSVPPRECGERILFLATPRIPARQTIETTTTATGDEATGTE